MICGQTPDYFRNIALEGDTPVEQAIKELQQQMRRKEDKERKILIFADSYGSGDNGVNNDHVIPWTEIVVSSLKPAWSKIQFLGGSSFTAGSKTTLQQLEDVIAEIGENQFGQITDIVFGYGVNDRNAAEQDLRNAMVAVNARIRALNTHCRIYLFPVGWMVNREERSKLVWLYNALYATFAPELGWAYANNTFMAMMGGNCFSPDTVHPSQKGNVNIARSVASVLCGGESVACEQGVARRLYDNTELFTTTCSGQNIIVGMYDNEYDSGDFTLQKFDNNFGYLTNSNLIGGGSIGTWIWCVDTSDIWHRVNVRIDFKIAADGTQLHIYNYDDPIPHVKKFIFPGGFHVIPADRG